jgi:sialic acid synthase SpsE
MWRPESILRIDGREIGALQPTYFVADIAANHDGNLERAKALIRLAAEAGADAAKFQHFSASSIVSDVGFRALGAQQSHQANWQKSVYQVYQDASVSMDWTETLVQTCRDAGITFFTSPYSLDIVDYIDPFVSAYKIGSGEITWIEIIEHIASKQKPYILATGASTMDDVHRAVSAALAINPRLAVMQCNTNYTASLENFRHIQLNVLASFRAMYPQLVLGLSDHTPGHATVLGAIALGARIIEKHFTDDVHRAGPDHLFSMDPQTWRDMVDRSRELENSLGAGIKQVEENERDTVVLQRRAIRLSRDQSAGKVLTRQDLIVLRPCPADGIAPYHLPQIVGRCVRSHMAAGAHLTWRDLD